MNELMKIEILHEKVQSLYYYQKKEKKSCDIKHNYPFPKGQGLCFAYESEDWHNLFLDNDNNPIIKKFFDNYRNLEAINDLINNYVAEDEYYDFVHNPELLKYCKQKNIQWWYGRIYLMNAKDARSKHVNLMVYKYWLSRKDDDDFNRNLKDWAGLKLYDNENSCVNLNRIGKPMAIDAYWNGGQDHKQMAIEVFLRDLDYNIIERTLGSLNNGLGFQWNGERYVYYFDEPEDEQQAFKLMDQKIKTLIEFLDNNIH